MALYFMCGRMASGKSTLAASLALEHDALLLSEDELLKRLFPNEIADLDSYVRCSTRLKSALEAHVCDLLARDLSVVLDFPANTLNQRAWFRKLIDTSGAPHQLHFVDATDETCKRQLRVRSSSGNADLAMQDETTFDLLSAYFVAPEPDEGFVVVRHERG